MWTLAAAMTDLRCHHDDELLARDEVGLHCPKCRSRYIHAPVSMYDVRDWLIEMVSIYD